MKNERALGIKLVAEFAEKQGNLFAVHISLFRTFLADSPVIQREAAKGRSQIREWALRTFDLIAD